MTDLVKGVLGGAWSILVGWILPTFISLQLVAIFIVPSLSGYGAIQVFQSFDLAARQGILVAIAATLGIVLAAAKTQLYAPLEGYALWPKSLAQRSRAKHRAQRDRWLREAEKAREDGDSLLYGLLYRRAARYPVSASQIAPTAFGNGIRRFETYAGDRYQLDSQLLWHHLQAAAPERVVQAVDQARTNVDFFVCLLYGAATTAVIAGVTLISGPADRSNLVVAIVLSAAVIVASYRLALHATDEWEAAVRALVDHGRRGVAEAFGLTIPQHLADERTMWRAVNRFVRRPYAEKSQQVEAVLDPLRSPPRSD